MGGPLLWIRNIARSTFVGDRGVQCVEYLVAPRAYWKGYLKLSLVSCPIALYPATSEREKISFHQLNKNTGHRIKYRKVDADTGDEVESTDIIKGYEVGKGEYLELDPEELDAIAIESKDRFTSAHDARKRTPKTLVLSAGIRLEGNADDSSLARNVNRPAQGRLHLSYDSRRSSRARSVHREIQRPLGRCLR